MIKFDRGENSGKQRRKARSRLPMSVCLVYLMVVTFLFTGVSFSKYVTTASGGEEARVAVVSSGVVVENIQVSGHPGDTDMVKAITVSNHETVSGKEQVCEVALQCKISTENVTGNIPLEFEFYEDEQCTKSLDEIIFSPNVKGEKTCYLKIIWPTNDNNEAYAFEIDAIRIVATATQID